MLVALRHSSSSSTSKGSTAHGIGPIAAVAEGPAPTTSHPRTHGFSCSPPSCGRAFFRASPGTPSRSCVAPRSHPCVARKLLLRFLSAPNRERHSRTTRHASVGPASPRAHARNTSCFSTSNAAIESFLRFNAIAFRTACAVEPAARRALGSGPGLLAGRPNPAFSGLRFAALARR